MPWLRTLKIKISIKYKLEKKVDFYVKYSSVGVR